MSKREKKMMKKVTCMKRRGKGKKVRCEGRGGIGGGD
jgi:hypothetical protein